MHKRITNNKTFLLIGLVGGLILMLAAARISVLKAEEAMAASPDQAAEFLINLGWIVSETPSGIKTVTIPETFDETYENYNTLQKSHGFDLSEHKGRAVTMYTYRILNHSLGGDVFGNVLVFGGEIIGGDICSYAIDGFMTGLDEQWTIDNYYVIISKVSFSSKIRFGGLNNGSCKNHKQRTNYNSNRHSQKARCS
ncbi:MAG: DUF4830 domain-containing protein [Oscillospiraceae bacterium]|nr:DUF4830 domain-containing protein [Oscillospiraceae bacterium]